MRAIALLSMWKTRNSLRTLFTDPRKLIPALLILGSMGFSLTMSTLGFRQQAGHAAFGDVKVAVDLLDAGVFLAMVLIAVGTIDTGLGDGLLAFAMPDVDYLFPSPIARRVVLAYRLPGLTFQSVFATLFFVYLFHVGFKMVHVELPVIGHEDPPWWNGPLGVALCVGIYLNLAMFIAIRFENRRLLHRVVMTFFLGGVGALVAVGYFRGISGFVGVVESPILNWAFLPCRWAANGLTAEVRRVSEATPILQLFFAYLASIIPMMATNSNFYEQSIASSERVATYRRAAKAGFAALQANRANTMKYKATRTYTVRPFGQGAGALAWSHLCAAVKRPYANFLFPTLAGIACGAVCAVANESFMGVGIMAVILITTYCSMGFMSSAKTASESAVRRRDLIAPLPIKAWESVAANLIVPWLSMFGYCVGAGLAYAAMGGNQWPAVLFGLCVFFSLRLAARMVLQYILVLGYPDFADKVQQFLVVTIYYLLALPFFLGELILAIPAILLHSVWLGLIMLTALQVGYLAVLLFLAGAASDRAIASGEPVRVFSLLTRRPRDTSIAG